MARTTILEQTTVTTEEFLNEIHREDAAIYFNVGNSTWKNKPQTYAEARKKLRWLNKDKDICYIVNSGGSKDHQINRINASFLDWDCGKDPERNYFPLNIVKEKKAEFLFTLKTSPLLPSFVVETRNGFQFYWLLYSGTTNEQFTELQQRIAYYFKGDPSVTNPARVMRLPGYDWVKPKKNCPPFPVCIIQNNSVRYIFSNLQDSFPSVSDEDYDSYKTLITGKVSSVNYNFLPTAIISSLRLS